MRSNPYIFDTHCDVLYKMFLDDSLAFADDSRLDANLERLRDASYLVQCFAIYMPNRMPNPSMKELHTYVEIFHKHILSHKGVVPIRSRQDLIGLRPGKAIGAMLTMEGANALQGDLDQLQIAFDLGIRCLGLTWNYANWAADGVLEPRQAGLTLKGRALIEECNRIGMIIDVSHLNEPGFWEVMQLSRQPVIATHSNVYSLCPHPRNLKHEQLEAIFAKHGIVGITYVPQFTKTEGEQANISDLIHHLEEVLTIGGSKQVGLGSDFDGISRHIHGLENAAKVSNLVDEIYRLYPASTAEDILWKNWYRFFENHLPDVN